MLKTFTKLASALFVTAGITFLFSTHVSAFGVSKTTKGPDFPGTNIPQYIQFNANYHYGNDEINEYSFYGSQRLYYVNHDGLGVYVPTTPENESTFDYWNVAENQKTYHQQAENYGANRVYNIFSTNAPFNTLKRGRTDIDDKTNQSYHGDNSGTMLINGNHYEYRYLGYNSDGMSIKNSYFPSDAPTGSYEGGLWNYGFSDDLYNLGEDASYYDAETMYPQKIAWVTNYLFAQYPGFQSANSDPSYWANRLSLKTNPTFEAGIWEGRKYENGVDYYNTVVTTNDVKNLRLSDITIKDSNGNTVAHFWRNTGNTMFDNNNVVHSDITDTDWYTSGTGIATQKNNSNLSSIKLAKGMDYTVTETIYNDYNGVNYVNPNEIDNTLIFGNNAVTDIDGINGNGNDTVKNASLNPNNGGDMAIAPYGTKTYSFSMNLKNQEGQTYGNSRYVSLGGIIAPGNFANGNDFDTGDDSGRLVLGVNPDDIALTGSQIMDYDTNQATNKIVPGHNYFVRYTVKKVDGDTPIVNPVIDISITDNYKNTVNYKQSANQTLYENGTVTIDSKPFKAYSSILSATAKIDDMYAQEGLDYNPNNNTQNSEIKSTNDVVLSNVTALPSTVYLTSDEWNIATTGVSTKTISTSATSATNAFANNMFYNQNGYAGMLTKVGNSYVTSGSLIATPEADKTVSVEQSSINPADFPNTISYNKDGYTGVLTKNGNYTYQSTSTPSTTTLTQKLVKDGVNSFPDSIVKEINGVDVVFTKSGDVTTKQVNQKTITTSKTSTTASDVPDSYYYDDGTFHGTLTKTSSNQWDNYDTINASATVGPQSWNSFSDTYFYNENGYSGTLTKNGDVTVTGSAPTYHKDFVGTSSGLFYWYASDGVDLNAPFPQWPQGYYDMDFNATSPPNGWAYEVSGASWVGAPQHDSRHGWERETSVNYNLYNEWWSSDTRQYSQNYSGTASKYLNTTYTKTYQGNVTETEYSQTYTANYSYDGSYMCYQEYTGTVTKPATSVDTRTYGQNYTGLVSNYNSVTKKSLTFNFTLENDNPEGQVKDIPVRISYGSFSQEKTFSVPANRPVNYSWTIDYNWNNGIPISVDGSGKMNFTIETNPADSSNKRAIFEYSDSTSFPYDNDIASCSINVVKRDISPQESNEVPHTSNTWNQTYTDAQWTWAYNRYQSGTWNFNTNQFDSVSGDENNHLPGYEKIQTSYSAPTKTVTHSESYNITHIYFRSKETTDENIGGASIASNGELTGGAGGWVDLLNTDGTANKTIGEIKSGYGFELKVIVKYKTNRYSGAPYASAPNPFDSNATSQVPFSITKAGSVTAGYQVNYPPDKLLIQTPSDSSGNSSSYTIGLDSNLYSTYDSNNNWDGFTQIYTLDSSDSQKYGLAKIFTDNNLQVGNSDNNHEFTIYTGKWDGDYDKPYTSQLFDIKPFYINVTGANTDDLKTHVIQ